MLQRRIWLPVLLIVGLLAAAALAVAAPEGDTFTDREEAGPEFVVQGEYAGKTARGDRLGAQVIALGNGTFGAVLLPGGLPGKGWDGRTRIRMTGKTEGRITRFGAYADGANGDIADRLFTGRTDSGEEFELAKVTRKSKTLGRKARVGAVVLFNGKNADAWQGGKMSEDGLLQVGTRTKQAFGDFTLHFEFRTPFMPKARGQGRGNSGLYLQDRYELQILDSFGLEGKNNECGGLYTLKAPDVNMCLPPLSWQTYDIDFQAARFDPAGKKVKNAVVTIWHNGVIIHNRLELTGPTPGGQREGPSPGAFQVQNHGNPVHVRNVWVVEKHAQP